MAASEVEVDGQDGDGRLLLVLLGLSWSPLWKRNSSPVFNRFVVGRRTIVGLCGILFIIIWFVSFLLSPSRNKLFLIRPVTSL